MPPIRLLLADDNALQRDLFLAMLQTDPAIHVVCAAQNGREALDGISQLHPDVVLFDMVMPQMDGFTLLNQVHRLELPHPPKMIALTSLGREDFILRAVAQGVDDYLIKPVEVEQLCQRIHEMCPTPQPPVMNIQPSMPAAPAPAEPEPPNEDLTRKYAAMLLMQLNMPAHLYGYQYLLEALVIAVHAPIMVNRMVAQLYPAVAKRCGTTSSCVERSIRTAIASAWERGGGTALNKVLGRTASIPADKPSNSELIAQLAARIRMKETK